MPPATRGRKRSVGVRPYQKKEKDTQKEVLDAPSDMRQLGSIVTGRQESHEQNTRQREPSFTEWTNLNDEDIARLTEALDHDLATHEEEANGFEELYWPESPPNVADEDVRAGIPVEVHREMGQVAEAQLNTFPEQGIRLGAGEAPQIQATRGSQDDPIAIEDSDDDNETSEISTPGRAHVRPKSVGMVQWASPEYEDSIITPFENKWIEIQTVWIQLLAARGNIQDKQINDWLDRFGSCVRKVCKSSRLARGSASFLLAEWQIGEDLWNTNTLDATFHQRVDQLSVLLKESESMETLYDAIIDYRGTAGYR